MARIAKKVFRKRRTTNRMRVNRSMIPRTVSIYRKPHFFKRNFNIGTVAGNVAYTPYSTATGFTLGNLPMVADFTTLFDQYRISHLQFRFHFRIDPGAQPAATAFYPRLFYAVDHDDLSPPTSLDEIRERNNVKVKVLQPNKDIVVNFKPSVLQVMYQSAIASGYVPKYNQWLDLTNTSVPHYGLKWCIDNFNNLDYRLDIEGVAWFQCKNTR